MMVGSKKQYMHKILSLLVILHCVHYCHPNLKNVVKIQGHLWLQMLHICQIYKFLITFIVRLLLKKNSNISAKMIKTEGLGEDKIAYMKHIKYIDATWASYLRQRIWHGKCNNVSMHTLLHFPCHILWRKYDAHMASMYFICFIYAIFFSPRPSVLIILADIFEFFLITISPWK